MNRKDRIKKIKPFSKRIIKEYPTSNNEIYK